MGRVTHADTQRMMAYLLGQRENVAKYWVTVTAGQTHTINSLGVSAATAVYWGDGLTNTYTGTARRTHVYAGAGTYCVKIYTPENVTELYLSDDAAVSVLNSADLKLMVNVSALFLYNLQKAVITIDSTDFSLMRPNTVYLYALSLASGKIDTKDFAEWNPTDIHLYKIPNIILTIMPASIKNWWKAATIDFRTQVLTQPQADLILWEAYQIPRTVTGGNILMSTTGNAAPSGTFQPCQNPPVSATTPGKEVAYELLNDSLGVGFAKWATVTTN